MTVIYVLLVAHFVGDFICQSDWMAQNKSQRWDALGLHVTVYGAVLLLPLLVLYPTSPEGLWFWLANVSAHFVQDAITSRVNKRLWFLDITATGDVGKIWRDKRVCVEPVFAVKDTGTRRWFFVGIGADQLLHYVCLFVTAEWWLR